MIVGIKSFGAYIPYYRISRAVISKAWGGGSAGGEKAVAGYDEDSLTLSIAAIRDCLGNIDPKIIDGVYFASTTAAYKEKQTASTIATILNLNETAITADFSCSLRSGTIALKAAIDAVASGSAKNVLVCAADTRLGYPNSDKELGFGDGAAAILISSDKLVAVIERSYTSFCEVYDLWRSDQDRYVRSWETGFSYGKLYADFVSKTTTTALKKFNLTNKDYSKAAIYAPEARQLERTAKTIGFDIKTGQVPDLHQMVGNTGSALALMSLVATLEDSNPGERILLVGYGDGCDVFSLKTTDEMEKLGRKRGIKGHLAIKKMISSYERYLIWRGQIENEPPRRVEATRPSAVALWRDNLGGLAFHGVKCKKCGTPQYPAERVCISCRTKDQFEDYSFADKIGRITNFSHDYLGVTLDPPITIATIDFEGGGRARLDMTDRELEEIKVNIPVEMTFRKIRYAGGIYNYWWKCRPVRGSV